MTLWPKTDAMFEKWKIIKMKIALTPGTPWNRAQFIHQSDRLTAYYTLIMFSASNYRFQLQLYFISHEPWKLRLFSSTNETWMGIFDEMIFVSSCGAARLKMWSLWRRKYLKLNEACCWFKALRECIGILILCKLIIALDGSEDGSEDFSLDFSSCNWKLREKKIILFILFIISRL